MGQIPYIAFLYEKKNVCIQIIKNTFWKLNNNKSFFYKFQKEDLAEQWTAETSVLRCIKEHLAQEPDQAGQNSHVLSDCQFLLVSERGKKKLQCQSQLFSFLDVYTILDKECFQFFWRFLKKLDIFVWSNLSIMSTSLSIFNKK